MSNSDYDSQDDASSNYSTRSSRTSLDSSSEHPRKASRPNSRAGSVSFSIHSPVAAGVFDDSRSIMAPTVFQPALPSTGMRRQKSEDVKVCLRVPVEESPVYGVQHLPPPRGHKAMEILGLPRPQHGARHFSAVPAASSSLRHSGIRRHTSACGSRRANGSTKRLEIAERRSSKSSATPPLSAAPCQIERRRTKRSPSAPAGVLTSKPSLASLSKDLPPTPPSPTLSEAENDLEHHLLLTAITDDNPFKWDEVINRAVPSDDDDLYSVSPPVLPRKSSKRDSLPLNVPRRSSKRKSLTKPLQNMFPSSHIASQYCAPSMSCPPVAEEGIVRSLSQRTGQNLTVTIPESARSATNSFTFSPIPVPELKDHSARDISPTVAEGVILAILQSLESLDDLFATAVVNKGFYRVFKHHELSLIKEALRKMSPPAWEHREICPPDNDARDTETPTQPEYTPTSYLQFYTRDMYIIAALKSLILDQCQSFLRPETAVALASSDQEISTRVDDTFWRIWSFCKLFGSGKGREDDVVAQMDWLKGGAMVHQEACRSTIFSTSSYDVSSLLATAPDYFARGNEGGLTAEQLYDMTELWNCLAVLLQGFEGRTEQARKHGVYEQTDVRGGDIDGEELMLEEWHHYLLTLGLSTILDLATPSKLQDASLFVLAADNGWVHWKPQAHGGSRRTFLKEAVSRVYEDKIASSFNSQGQKEMLRQLSKQRIQRHVLEIRKRRDNGATREVRMSMERPMSNWEHVMARFNGPHPDSGIPTPRGPPPSTPLPRVPEAMVARGYRVPTPPPIENHPAFAQHPLQRQIHDSDVAENTAEKAIYRIVEMGFTADQARHALRMTDMGDGLRVDRAVELLLRA